MAQSPEVRSFRFLYRQSEGAIDGATWLRASLMPMGLAIVMTAIWIVIAPTAPRDLAHQAFIEPSVVAKHLYLIIYAFALILCFVAEYFVSAKRFTDRGRPQAFAGFLPFSLLLDGAAHWYQPRSLGAMPPALTYLFDAVAIAVIVWNIVELGFYPSRPRDTV